MIKNKLKLGLIILWISLFFGSILLPQVKPKVAYANPDDGCSVWFSLQSGIKTLNNMERQGNGSVAMQRIASSTSLTFVNAGTIKVDVGVSDRLFTDPGVSNTSIQQAFSGDYNWGQDPDGNWGYVRTYVDLGAKVEGDSIAAFGFIKPSGGPPKEGASDQQIKDWLNKLRLFIGVKRTASLGSFDEYSIFVDEKNDGDYNGDWTCFKNAVAADWPMTDTGDWSGADLGLSVQAGKVKTEGITVRYFYKPTTIYSPESDGVKATSYTFGSATTTPKNFFKQDGGTAIIYDDSWDNMSAEQVQKLFDTAGLVDTTLHQGAKTTKIKVAGAQSSASQNSSTGGNGFGSNGDDNVNCETSGNVIGWILCPIINGSLDGAALIFRNFIEPFLKVNPISTSDTSPNVSLITSWRSFRTLGNIVLIFALLFIVFGQSIGGGMVDAYTAKKTMPRILTAVILVNLSIYIVAIAIDIFNILGNGMTRLILSAAKDSGQLKIKPKAGESAAIGFVSILALVIAGFLGKQFWIGEGTSGSTKGALAAALPYLLLFVVLPIFLAALSVFVTLLMRQGIIVMLAVISPVALALFALPGAEKYAKKWFDALIKSLLVYPIITTIFAVSQLLAVLIYSANNGGVLALIAVAIVAFAPLFMIPFAFKMAGGVIAGVAGAVTKGRENFKKSYGGDPHDPNSLHHRMSHAARENAAHRIKTGAATSGSRILRRFTSDQQKANALASVSAARASKAAGVYARSKGITDQAEIDRISSHASTAASKGSRYGAGAAETAGEAAAIAAQNRALSSEQIAAAGSAAASYHSRHSSDAGYSKQDAYDAGTHAASLVGRGVTDEYVRATASQAYVQSRKSAAAAGSNPRTQNLASEAASSAAVRSMGLGRSATDSTEDARAASSAAYAAHQRLSTTLGPGGTPLHVDVIDGAATAAARSAAKARTDGRSNPTGAADAAADFYANNHGTVPADKLNDQADLAGDSIL